MGKQQPSKHRPATSLKSKIELIRSTAKRWPPAGASDDIAAHSFLGLNIEAPEFSKRLSELEKSNPEGYAKILGVTARLQLVNAIERESVFTFSWIRIQADALKVYLLCTCLDALAGQSSYLQYHQWIQSEEQSERLERALAETYANGMQPSDWYRTVTHRLGEVWLEDYGVSRNFRQMIAELPDAIRSELVTSYALVREPRETREGWFNLSDDERLKRVVKYLYELRRNTFTHKTQIVPTVNAGQGVVGWVSAIPQGIWRYAVYFTNVDDVRDEISLLRLVLIGKMRQLMNYKVDDDFVSLYWKTERVRRMTWRAIRELIYNDEVRCIYLKQWPVNLANETKYRRPKRFAMRSLEQLALGKAMDFSWFYPRVAEADHEIRSDINKYVIETHKINKLIERYENLAVRSRVADRTKIAAYEKIRDAVRDGKWTALAESIMIDMYFVLEGAPEQMET